MQPVDDLPLESPRVPLAAQEPDAPTPSQPPQSAAPFTHVLDAQQDWMDFTLRGDPEARQRLIEANLRLVGSIVRRFSHRWGDPEDLFQVGCIGLMKAIDGFDPGRQVRFSTYAVPVIIGEIRRHLREQSSLRVSRGMRALAHRIEETRRLLSQELGRSPSVEEIARRLEVAPEEVAAAQEASRPPESLDEVVASPEGEGLSLYDRLGDGEPELARLVDSLALRQALQALPSWERRLVALRYLERRSQSETARELGVSQPHISRAERRILALLRQNLS